MLLESRHRNRDELNINLTPLIDVILTLIIFFMISTRFNRDTQIELNLPEADGPQMAVEQQIVEISIDASGNIFVNGQPLVNNQLDTVKRAVEDVSEGDNTRPMVISADEKAPFQAVVTAMDAAGQLGFAKQKIATQSPKQG
ncbi:ExbD/TolR family protein [Permianibacter aggregans]|uniref:Biopolymer transport protein ExbD n=1 Tax=Permianibacter aggregans TaxID=1510150 RepID=A0A4R6UWV7_9GAMM|nr:biopolymer transporter ExbD [Permianibacter aggregans]TDQ50393.1 biopolymer transport protein ExbD [Permianibacter aggregans]